VHDYISQIYDCHIAIVAVIAISVVKTLNHNVKVLIMADDGVQSHREQWLIGWKSHFKTYVKGRLYRGVAASPMLARSTATFYVVFEMWFSSNHCSLWLWTPSSASVRGPSKMSLTWAQVTQLVSEVGWLQRGKSSLVHGQWQQTASWRTVACLHLHARIA